MKKETDRPVTVRLPVELYFCFQREAEESGTTVSGVIRTALERQIALAPIALKLEEVALAVSGLTAQMMELSKTVGHDSNMAKAAVVTIEAFAKELLGEEKFKNIRAVVDKVMAQGRM